MTPSDSGVAPMKCPICKKPVADDAPDRPKTYPFCSERCQLIDLGRWLDGKYQIPVEDRSQGSGIRSHEENEP